MHDGNSEYESVEGAQLVGDLRRPLQLAGVVVLDPHYDDLLLAGKHLDVLLVAFPFVGLLQPEVRRFEITGWWDLYL